MAAKPIKIVSAGATAGQFAPEPLVLVGTLPEGSIEPAEAQADSTAAELEDLVDDFNDLLAKLRAAGILASS